MPDPTPIPEGAEVRFTAPALATMRKADDFHFSDHIAHAGDHGSYGYEHPTLEGWHMCVVLVDDEQLLVPCRRGQFAVL